MRSVLVALLLLLACAPAAAAAVPADAYLGRPIEAAVYDRATHCTPSAQRPGTAAFVRWLQGSFGGAFWGDYRCERWGARSASLHAERRAVDWHLDAGVPAQKAEAQRLIAVLLAPDSAGNSYALARRMGVQEIIWDCAYWRSGLPRFRWYGPCLTRTGALRTRVDRTTAHRDHVHLGLSIAGAMGRTSAYAR